MVFVDTWFVRKTIRMLVEREIEEAWEFPVCTAALTIGNKHLLIIKQELH
jgi:hypothetical protein